MADHADAAPLETHQALQGAMLELSAPQPNYRALLEAGGFAEPAEGVAMSFNRANTEFVLRNHALFSSRVEMSMGNVRPMIPLNVDPPHHSKYRKLLDPMFAPRRMEEQETEITRRANGFIDAFIDRGECNFTEEFAELFPSSIFLGLLGLPEDQMRAFLDMRDYILHPAKIDPEAALDVEKRRAVNNLGGEIIYNYFTDLIEQRQKEPGDDIISRFLAAEVGGDKLSNEDILDIMFLFVIAGLDTVSDSLTCFFAFLAQHPAHRRQIVEEPSIIPSAVEELLRWESPVPAGVPRVATEDVVLPGGQKIGKGTAVVVSYGAADVDPATFGDPFEVRLGRENNPHIAFGGGVHRCLGSHLARRELRIVLREWHRRIPEYWLKPGHERLEYPPGLRHVKDLTLAWT
ncbi:MAG: cytochrome P450 [Acidimicrobiales bacterium]